MSGLSIWVVYDHPEDQPPGYIAREHVATAEGSVATANALWSRSLEHLHAALEQRGLVRFERDPGDDPVIIEVWL